MFKIAGVILCIAGAAGYGYLKIAGWNQAVKELEQWLLLFDKMKSQICYRRDVITEICCGMDEKMYGIGGSYVASVGRELQDDRTKSFEKVWEEKMTEWSACSFLPAEVKKSIQSFPEYIGEQDAEQQVHYLDFYRNRLLTEKVRMETEMNNKKKPVMAVSLISGITVCVLLL